MNRFKVLVPALVIFLAIAASAYAKKDSKEEGASVKFGYVDINRALNEVEEGKRAKKELEVQINDKKQKIAAYETELKNMKAELEKKSLVLSKEAMKEKEEEFRKKFIDVQQKITTFQTDIANKEKQLTEGIVISLREIVKGIGTEGGYTMILETSRDVVLYAPPESDLTDRVIGIFNAKKGKK